MVLAIIIGLCFIIGIWYNSMGETPSTPIHTLSPEEKLFAFLLNEIHTGVRNIQRKFPSTGEPAQILAKGVIFVNRNTAIKNANTLSIQFKVPLSNVFAIIDKCADSAHIYYNVEKY